MEYKMFHSTILSEKKFLLSFLMFALRIKCLLKLIMSFYENEQTFFPIGVCLTMNLRPKNSKSKSFHFQLL